MKIAISVDSACDIPQELKDKYNIFVIPYYVMLGEKECVDGVDISSKDIFEYVANAGILPKTAALNSERFVEHFTNILKDYDAIIHIGLSWKMTSSGQNSLLASQELDNVYVVDSGSLSSGIGLLALSCAEKIEEGKDIQTILKELEEEKPKVQASFFQESQVFQNS